MTPATSRSRLLFFVLSLLLVLPLVTATLLGAPADTGEAGEDSLFKHLSVFTEVLSLVRRFYVEEPDAAALMAGALDGATDALDPFSIFVPPEGVEVYGPARDVGASLSGLVLLRDRGVVYVVGVRKGSPAEEAGIEVGDIVTRIQGEATRQLPMWRIQSILARPRGSRVELEVLRLQDRLDLAFDLGPFAEPPAQLDEVEGEARLRVYGIGPKTAAQVEQALAEAGRQQRQRLLVDLRGVTGGDPAAAYATAALFASGELGFLRDREEDLQRFASEAPPRWRGKLVVLVDSSTLGAAEVLAKVLREKAGAELVGRRTFGYAGTQTEVQLPAGGRLWITRAFYTGPDHEPIRESLEPDLRVTESSRALGEADLPMEEVILRRGLERLRAEDGEGLARAA